MPPRLAPTSRWLAGPSWKPATRPKPPSRSHLKLKQPASRKQSNVLLARLLEHSCGLRLEGARLHRLRKNSVYFLVEAPAGCPHPSRPLLARAWASASARVRLRNIVRCRREREGNSG